MERVFYQWRGVSHTGRGTWGEATTMGRVISHFCAASVCGLLLFSGGTPALAAPVSSASSHMMSSSVTRPDTPASQVVPGNVLPPVTEIGSLRLTTVTVGSSDHVYPSVWSEPEIRDERLIPSAVSAGIGSAADAHLTLQLPAGTRVVSGMQYQIPVRSIGELPVHVLSAPSHITTADGVTLFTVSHLADGSLCLTATSAATHLVTPIEASFTIAVGFLPPTTIQNKTTIMGTPSQATNTTASSLSFGFMIGTTQWKGTLRWTPETSDSLVSSFTKTVGDKNKVTALSGVAWAPLQNLLTQFSMQNQQPLSLASQPFYVMNIYTSPSPFTWSLYHQTFLNTMSSEDGTSEWTSTVMNSSPLTPLAAPVSTITVQGSVTLQDVRDRLTTLVHAYVSGKESLHHGESIVIHGVLANGDHVLGMITNLGSFDHPLTTTGTNIESVMTDQMNTLQTVYPGATAASEITAGATLLFPSPAHTYSYTHYTSLWWKNTMSMVGMSNASGTTCPVTPSVATTSTGTAQDKHHTEQKTVASQVMPFMLTTNMSHTSTGSVDMPVTTAIILTQKKTPIAHDYIVYEPNGGTGTAIMQAVTRGEQPVTEANTFLYQGKHFIGWNTKANGSGTWYDPGSLQSPVTESTRILYAQWAPDHVANPIHTDNPIVRSPLASTGAAITAIFCSMLCFVGLGFAVKHYRDEQKPWKDPDHKIRFKK